jgi:hypothetical protein
MTWSPIELGPNQIDELRAAMTGQREHPKVSLYISASYSHKRILDNETLNMYYHVSR